MGQNSRRPRNLAYVAAYCDMICITGKPGSNAINQHLFREGTISAQQFFRDLCLSRCKGSAKSGNRYRKLYIKMAEKANEGGYRNASPDRVLTQVEKGLVLDIIATRNKGRKAGTLLDGMSDTKFAAIVLNVSMNHIKQITNSVWSAKESTNSFRSIWERAME